MAPVARRPLHLGFIGQGTTSATKIASLLSDLIDSAGGKAKVILPATKAHWTEGIEAVADWAIENEIPISIITDDSTASHKVLKNYVTQASEKLKAANVATKIVDVTANGSGKMIFLWDDEDDDCYTALERCEAKEVEALDLTAGLHPLEFTGGGDAEPEAEPEPDAEPEADDWDAMDEDALQAQADEWGVDVTALETWDDVRNALRAFEAEGGEAEDGGVPTSDEVLEWDFPTLKQYAADNGIEVPPRSRTSGYREAITAWLEGQAPVDEDDAGLELPADDDALPMEVGEFDFTGVTEPITEAIADLRTDISALASNIADLAGLIGELNTPAPKPVPAAPKAAPAKAVARKSAAAPVKAAAKRPVSRPAPKAAAVEAPAERPLDAFMHLLGKKLTKAQATAIMVANAQKGRGRPTEDERKLVIQAKALVPQV